MITQQCLSGGGSLPPLLVVATTAHQTFWSWRKWQRVRRQIITGDITSGREACDYYYTEKFSPSTNPVKHGWSKNTDNFIPPKFDKGKEDLMVDAPLMAGSQEGCRYIYIHPMLQASSILKHWSSVSWGSWIFGLESDFLLLENSWSNFIEWSEWRKRAKNGTQA